MEADADLYFRASPMWKQHIGICTALVLLGIPLYVADRYLLKGGGGGWISLNLNGLIIIPYIAFVAVQIAVSSLALFQFPTARVLPLHLLSGVISIGLLVVGFFAYSGYERAQETADYEKRMETIRQLREAIELREWWYEPNAEAPTEIHVRVKVSESGRFSGNAEGRAAGNFGEMIFNTQDSPQRQAGKGEEFSFVFPLHFLSEGKADAVSIALYLFKDQTGTVPEDLAIIFEDNPSTEYDGHFIYKQIPPPTPKG
ncbi:MAG: hypothetical protein DMG14_33750 [Acidobacteria bacterium]|nr:MAG: hypothetical protein DMG14_33750 [Acidobacteriota bacterium]